MPISVIVLTFNAEATIGATLASARKVSDDVHVVDSFSTDRTLDIAREAGAQVVQHEFANYSAQRNWATDTLPLRHDWELHLDADERLSDELAAEINALMVAAPPKEVAGYHIPRLVHFHGRALRHGGMYPIYHLRLFRHGRGRCEMRKYDQHFFVDGATARLNAPMIDDIRQPLFLRAFLLFLYRYVWKRGFLDGTEGMIFYVLQTFWFRFLVDAKLYERRKARQK